MNTAFHPMWFRLSLLGILLGAIYIILQHHPNDADYATRVSADIAILFYFLALCLTINNSDSARYLWLMGSVIFLVHVLIAFGEVHAWSHTKAVLHVEEVSGFGKGIIFSYLFCLVWLSDALVGMLRPRADLARSVGVRWATHLFLAFIVVNGTIVYESGPIRWFSLASFVLVLLLLVKKYRRKTENLYPIAHISGVK
ncbi:MAG: hypothetical protein N2112_03610 [Gemmataceae bacterium]|nr:hypothetical protein [Gemmataceae bacterium]